MYRDQCYPGGVRNNVFIDWWFETWVRSQQRGLSVRSNEDLLADFVDFPQVARDHPHNDDFWKNNTPSMENIKVPFYTVANICDHPISTHSHFRLMDEARTPKDKQWLEIIAGKHVPPMYEAENVRSQRRFLDYILKDADNGWNEVWGIIRTIQRVLYQFSILGSTAKLLIEGIELSVTSLATGVAQYHNEGDKMMFNTGFPYANYVKHLTLEEKRAGSAVSFVTAPFERATLVAGQAIAKLFVSVNGATDTDIFLALRYLSKDGHEILFEGILDSPSLPVATGCIRLSKRRVDDKISHGDLIYIDGSKVEPVEEGRIVETCLMLSPISVVIEKGGRLLLEISSRSIENVFPYVKCDPNDRKMGGNVFIHTGGNHGSALTLPFQTMEVCGMAEGV
ncbi:hypothetical protein ACN42_g9932 [Penicillium freii]|uniref:Xaa-Pro dipeptidyl-peptidase C-terminal domain-containing protein n=1 Tax=Penicillium freii TaxID=48697 RepID=A0A101MAZ0_PENFR|nr:hypothetical protein ACN42_g9932 [Penicillium freii]